MIVAKAGKMPALPGKIKTYKINKDKNLEVYITEYC